jgi:hypothetical protein
MPDWLFFGDFDLVSEQIEMAGARTKCFEGVTQEHITTELPSVCTSHIPDTRVRMIYA